VVSRRLPHEADIFPTWLEKAMPDGNLRPTRQRRWITLRNVWISLKPVWTTLRHVWISLKLVWITLKHVWIELQSVWITLNSV
jgi:hypothetical protein